MNMKYLMKTKDAFLLLFQAPIIWFFILLDEFAVKFKPGKAFTKIRVSALEMLSGRKYEEMSIRNSWTFFVTRSRFIALRAALFSPDLGKGLTFTKKS